MPQTINALSFGDLGGRKEEGGGVLISLWPGETPDEITFCVSFRILGERNAPQRKDFRQPSTGGCSSLDIWNKDAVPVVWLGW